jgi:hypothetical protein
MKIFNVPLVFWLAFCVALVHLIACQLLFNELKKNHREEFLAIGSPHILLNNTPINNWLFLKWIMGASFKKLNGNAIRLVWLIRATIAVCLCYFFIGFLYFIISFPSAL